MKTTLLVIASTVVLATPLAAVTVANGSFEDLDSSYVNVPLADFMDDAAATNWERFNSPDWVLSGGPAGLYNTPDGTHFTLAGATGTFAGGVYREGVFQDVSGFTVGASYEISFSHANGLRYDQQTSLYQGVGTVGGWQVLVDSTSLGLVASTNDNSTPAPAFTADWQSSSVTFTATDTTHEIRFVAYKPDGMEEPTFQFLDQVAVDLVPEPSIGLLAGLGALLLWRRRR